MCTVGSNPGEGGGEEEGGGIDRNYILYYCEWIITG